MEGLLLILQIGHPRCVQVSLLHAALQGAGGEQVLHILRGKLLAELADTRLLHAELAELTAHGAELLTECSDALAQCALLLCQLRKLVDVLLRELTKLHAELALRLSARQTELTQLLPDLPQCLAAGLLLRGSAHAKLAARLGQLARGLRAGKTLLRCRLLRTDVLLCACQTELTRLCGSLQTELVLLKPKLAALPRILCGKLVGVQARLRGKLGNAQARLRLRLRVGGTELLRRKTQLGRLTSAALCKLFRRKPELTSLTGRLQGSARPCLSQLTCKTGGLLRAALLRLKRLLRTLRSAFKAGLPHLARGPSLLFQDVALQLLLGHGLAAAAERSGAHGLRANALLCDLALTGDILKRLLDSVALKLIHKCASGRGVKRPRGAPKGADALHRGLLPKATGLHQPLLCGRGGGPSARSGVGQTGLPNASCSRSARRCLTQLLCQRLLQSARLTTGQRPNPLGANPQLRELLLSSRGPRCPCLPRLTDGTGGVGAIKLRSLPRLHQVFKRAQSQLRGLARETRKVLHAALSYILTLLDSLAYLAYALLANTCAQLDGLAQPLVCRGLKLER